MESPHKGPVMQRAFPYHDSEVQGRDSAKKLRVHMITVNPPAKASVNQQNVPNILNLVALNCISGDLKSRFHFLLLSNDRQLKNRWNVYPTKLIPQLLGWSYNAWTYVVISHWIYLFPRKYSIHNPKIIRFVKFLISSVRFCAQVSTRWNFCGEVCSTVCSFLSLNYHFKHLVGRWN